MTFYAVIDTNLLVSALLSSHDDAATVLVVGKLFSGEVIPLFSLFLSPFLKERLFTMSFLSGLFRSRDTPTNSTNGSAYRFLFSGSTAGKPVNERSAMQMTAVYACVRILSESIAGLPVHLYRYTENGNLYYFQIDEIA